MRCPSLPSLLPQTRRRRGRAPGPAVIAAIARPVVHAVSLMLEVAVIAAASVLGLAGIGGIAFLELRACRRQARTHHEVAWHIFQAPDAAQGRSGPRVIEAPRLRVIHLDHAKEETGERTLP